MQTNLNIGISTTALPTSNNVIINATDNSEETKFTPIIERMDLICALSKQYLYDPWILVPCGHTFNHSAIYLRHLETKTPTCPVCEKFYICTVENLFMKSVVKSLGITMPITANGTVQNPSLMVAMENEAGHTSWVPILPTNIGNSAVQDQLFQLTSDQKSSTPTSPPEEIGIPRKYPIPKNTSRIESAYIQTMEQISQSPRKDPLKVIQRPPLTQITERAKQTGVNIATIKKILIKKGLSQTNFNEVDEEGNTILHLIVLEKDNPNGSLIAEINFLLDNNANPNVQNFLGKTPLHLASQLGRNHVIKALIQGGALASFRDKEGKLPSDCVRNMSSKNALATSKRLSNSSEYNVIQNTSASVVQSPDTTANNSDLQSFSMAFVENEAMQNLPEFGLERQFLQTTSSVQKKRPLEDIQLPLAKIQRRNEGDDVSTTPKSEELDIAERGFLDTFLSSEF